MFPLAEYGTFIVFINIIEIQFPVFLCCLSQKDFFSPPQHNAFIIWAFHKMHPGHTHFPFLPYPPFHLSKLFPSPEKKKRKERSRSNLCSLCTHWRLVAFQVACPFERIESFPTVRSRSAILQSIMKCYTSVSL